jgi:hypothetical protein
MPASLWLEILKGGPFDGLPALSLRFEDEGCDLDETPLAILSSMSPPPMHLKLLWVMGGNESSQAIVHLVGRALAFGMATSIEIYGSVWPWMLEGRLIGWRTLHTSDPIVPYPVEEIVYHGETAPAFEFFPFHLVRPPTIWWAPPLIKGDILSMIPQGVRLWTARKRVEKRLYPKEDGIE